MNYTHHGKARKAERKIEECNVIHAITEGKIFYRQGMKFYVHPNNRLIVVTSNSGKPAASEQVITVYNRNNAIKYVKLKPKRKEKHQEQPKSTKHIRPNRHDIHRINKRTMNAA